jgi:hypothetical protein
MQLSETGVLGRRDLAAGLVLHNPASRREKLTIEESDRALRAIRVLSLTDRI